MKKSLIFASVAFAGAFALNADWTCQNWFKGVGGTDTPDGENLPASLYPANGTWAAVKAPDAAEFAGTLSINDNNDLVFDLDDGEHLDFTIGNTDPADTNTITDVEVTGVFTPLTGTLPENSTMNGRNAQVGFVVAINGDATNYCAWVGSGWVELTNAAVNAGANIDQETSLLVRFDYRSSTKYASFAILSGNPVVTNFLGNSVGTVALTVSSDAVASNRVCGVSCYGSGTLAKADGGVGLGVADANGVKYGSLADAVAAAETSETTINVLRETSESVTLPENSQITINDNGKVGGQITVPSGTEVKVTATSDEVHGGVSGSSYSIPLKVNASADDVAIVLPGTVGDYKEVVNVETSGGGSSLTFDLQTKADIVTNLTPVVGGKALCKNEEALRNFLNTNVSSVYNGADSSKGNLETALQAPDSTSGRPLWQSYVLGVAPSASLAPVTAPADVDGSKITLVVPAGTPSGDYSVTYKVDGVESTGGSTIKIDTTSSGTHSVTIELE